MRSAVVKRSVVIAGHNTSVSLEDEFWSSLKEIGKGQELTLSALVAVIDTQRQKNENLSSAIRLFVLNQFRMEISGTSTNRVEASNTVQLMRDGRQSQRLNGRTREHPEP